MYNYFIKLKAFADYNTNQLENYAIIGLYAIRTSHNIKISILKVVVRWILNQLLALVVLFTMEIQTRNILLLTPT